MTALHKENPKFVSSRRWTARDDVDCWHRCWDCRHRDAALADRLFIRTEMRRERGPYEPSSPWVTPDFKPMSPVRGELRSYHNETHHAVLNSRCCDC